MLKNDMPKEDKVIVVNGRDFNLIKKALRNLVSSNADRLKKVKSMGSIEFLVAGYGKECDDTLLLLKKIEAMT